jgi:tRNA nucleotidyltransferase (CCA-adding enzyme)
MLYETVLQYKELLKNKIKFIMIGECVRNAILSIHAPRHEIIVGEIKSSVLLTILKKVPHSKITQRRGTIIVTNNNIDYNFILENTLNETSIIKHLKSKNYTFDAIGYNPTTKQFINPFEGLRDIKLKAIKLIEPSVVKRNSLLLLSASRFAAQLNFSIPLETWFAMYDNATLIETVKTSLLKDELTQLLLTPKPSIGIHYLQETGVLTHFLPEVALSSTVLQTRRGDAANVFQHTMYALDASEKTLIIRLAILFHDCGKLQTMTCDARGNIHFFGHEKVGAEIAKKHLTVLQFPLQTIDTVYNLILNHMFDASPYLKPAAVKRLIKKVGVDQIWNLVSLREADRQGTPAKISMRKITLLKKKIAQGLKNV